MVNCPFSKNGILSFLLSVFISVIFIIIVIKQVYSNKGAIKRLIFFGGHNENSCN